MMLRDEEALDASSASEEIGFHLVVSLLSSFSSSSVPATHANDTMYQHKAK